MGRFPDHGGLPVGEEASQGKGGLRLMYRVPFLILFLLLFVSSFIICRIENWEGLWTVSACGEEGTRRKGGSRLIFFPLFYSFCYFFLGGKGEEMLMFPFRGGFSGKLSQGRGGSIDFFLFLLFYVSFIVLFSSACYSCLLLF